MVTKKIEIQVGTREPARTVFSLHTTLPCEMPDYPASAFQPGFGPNSRQTAATFGESAKSVAIKTRQWTRCFSICVVGWLPARL